MGLFFELTSHIQYLILINHAKNHLHLIIQNKALEINSLRNENNLPVSILEFLVIKLNLMPMPNKNYVMVL